LTQGSSGQGGDLPARLPTRWPLQGRRRELELAAGALARSHGAVLAGEPGVGKTRLAQEIMEVARRPRPPDPVGRRHPAGALDRVRRPGPPGAGGAGRGPGPAGDAPARAGRHVALPGDRGLVLGVDDAHLLDDASAALVHLAASTSTAIVVATTQTAHTGQDVVTTLWKEGLAERIELLPLTQEETAALAAEVLGGELDLRTAHRLWQTTRGNPLYLRELLLTGVGGGHLRRSDRVWRWRGPIRVGSRLAEVVQRRLGELGPELREALESSPSRSPSSWRCWRRWPARRGARGGAGRGGHDRARRPPHQRPACPPALRRRPARGDPSPPHQRVMARLAAALEATGARRQGTRSGCATGGSRAGLPIPPDVLLAGAIRARAPATGRSPSDCWTP